MDGMASVVIVNIIFGLVDLSGRLNDRDTDGLLLRIVYGERVRDAMTAARVRSCCPPGPSVCAGWPGEAACRWVPRQPTATPSHEVRHALCSSMPAPPGPT
jgi:hypothetical protein